MIVLCFKTIMGVVPVVERAVGIEPTTSAWEADVLPLNYARSNRSIIAHTPEKIKRLFGKRSKIFAALCGARGKQNAIKKFFLQFSLAYAILFELYASRLFLCCACGMNKRI